MTLAEPTTGETVDLSVPRRFHIVGVGGPGMSAVAILLSRMGHTVTGSDLHEVLPPLHPGHGKLTSFRV